MLSNKPDGIVDKYLGKFQQKTVITMLLFTLLLSTWVPTNNTLIWWKTLFMINITTSQPYKKHYLFTSSSYSHRFRLKFKWIDQSSLCSSLSTVCTKVHRHEVWFDESSYSEIVNFRFVFNNHEKTFIICSFELKYFRWKEYSVLYFGLRRMSAHCILSDQRLRVVIGLEFKVFAQANDTVRHVLLLTNKSKCFITRNVIHPAGQYMLLINSVLIIVLMTFIAFHAQIGVGPTRTKHLMSNDMN